MHSQIRAAPAVGADSTVYLPLRPRDDTVGGSLIAALSLSSPADRMKVQWGPLVKETAPAVVNVYASQQVQARYTYLYEKVDGTNARMILTPGGDWLLGSREELQISVVREYHARFEQEVFFPALQAPRGLPRLRALHARQASPPRGFWPSPERRHSAAVAYEFWR